MPSITDFVTVREIENTGATRTMLTLKPETVERDGKQFVTEEPQLVVAMVRESSHYPNRVKVSFGAKLGRPIAPGQPRPRVEFPVDGMGATEIRLEMN